MTTDHNDLIKAVDILMGGFIGSKEQIKGQREAWQRFLGHLSIDKQSPVGQPTPHQKFVIELVSSIEDILDIDQSDDDNRINKILAIWRNAYLAQTETTDGRRMNIKDRFREYNRSVREVNRWLSYAPLWLDEYFAELVKIKANEELEKLRDKFKLYWFVSERINYGNIGMDVIPSKSRADSAINAGMWETYNLMKESYKRIMIIEVMEVITHAFELDSSWSGREINIERRLANMLSKSFR